MEDEAQSVITVLGGVVVAVEAHDTIIRLPEGCPTNRSSVPFIPMETRGEL